MLPPERAKPAHKSVHCRVGDGPHSPHPPRPRKRWQRGPGPTSALQGNRAKCARHADKGGGACTLRHTHNRHAARSIRATRPSFKNAQTAWNCVPEGEGMGRPDRATRGTHREGREKRGNQGGGNENLHRPRPPRSAVSAAQTQTGHCTRQGSSGAQRPAPTLRLGSLGTSPWGSH